MSAGSSNKDGLFERTEPLKALAVMALPTMASQLVLLIYNLADTWFIGRTDNPFMIGASSLVLTVYLALAAIANVFGVGGGSQMARLLGEKKTEQARKVASYSIALSVLSALVFSLLLFVFMSPILHLLGASDNTFEYCRQYLLMTAVLGGIPTVLSMSMPQLLRNAGYSKEAGLGVGLGSILNIALDPLFMFVILPAGNEVLGAAIATFISNVISFIYFVIIFRKVRNETVLTLPRRIEKIGTDDLRAVYSVGIPAALSIFLFDIVTIVINRLAVSYGDIPLAAMGIVLKLERIPINIGLGVCLGMVPLIAYNYGAKNRERMNSFFSLARVAVIGFACLCMIVFWVFAEPILSSFIDDGETVRYGVMFIRGRCFSLPFMMIGYLIVNYMNAVNRGKVSLLLGILRHIVLIIPIMLVMNNVLGIDGLIWSQLVADVINTIVVLAVYRRVSSRLIEVPVGNEGPIS